MPTVLCGFNSTPEVHGSGLLVQHGPTLRVQIGFDPTYQGPPQLATLPEEFVHALVDTGATECCIDSGLAMQLNLPIVDQVVIAGAGGAHNANMHLAQIHIPGLNFTMYGAFAAVNLAAGGQPHLALMGRSFLRGFVLAYNGVTGDVAITNDPFLEPPPVNPAAA